MPFRREQSHLMSVFLSPHISGPIGFYLMELRRPFFVADFDSRGEMRSKVAYLYAELEQIPGASDLIAICSTNLWRSPEEFESSIPGGRGGLTLRWFASAPTAGIATIRFRTQICSLSMLVTGLNRDADRLTLAAFQQHQL